MELDFAKDVLFEELLVFVLIVEILGVVFIAEDILYEETVFLVEYLLVAEFEVLFFKVTDVFVFFIVFSVVFEGLAAVFVIVVVFFAVVELVLEELFALLAVLLNIFFFKVEETFAADADVAVLYLFDEDVVFFVVEFVFVDEDLLVLFVVEILFFSNFFNASIRAILEIFLLNIVLIKNYSLLLIISIGLNRK